MAEVWNADGPVSELRLALTVPDLDGALQFWRDALGLPEVAVFEQNGGQVVVLGAGQATIELLDENQAAFVDELEVGRRVAPPIRLALHVADTLAVAERLTSAGAEVIGGPILTPWGDRNVRMTSPQNIQLTLFSE